MPVDDPTSVFLISPANAPFLRGDDRKLRDMGKQTMIMLLMGAALSAICIGGIVGSSTELRIRRQLSKSGVVAEARIENHKASGGTSVGGGRTSVESYFVTYSFSVAQPDGLAQPFTREEQVSVNLYELRIGSTARIWYSSQDPNLSRLIDNRISNKALLIGMTLLLLPGLLLLYAGILAVVKTSRLERHGRLLTGEIAACVRPKGAAGVNVQYRFHSPAGVEVTGQQVAFRKDLQEGALPPEGTRVAVLYVNDKTHRLL